jgi:hypothetical protein
MRFERLDRYLFLETLRSAALPVFAERRAALTFDFPDIICSSFVFSYSLADAGADKPPGEVSPGTTVAVKTSPFRIKKRPVNPITT